MTTAKDIYIEITKDVVTIFNILYSQVKYLNRFVVCKRSIIQTLASFAIHRMNGTHREIIMVIQTYTEMIINADTIFHTI